MLQNLRRGGGEAHCYLRMNVHVLLQADGVAEGLPADVAAKRPRPAVGPPDVDLQSVRCREHLLFFWVFEKDSRCQRGYLVVDTTGGFSPSAGGKNPCSAEVDLEMLTLSQVMQWYVLEVGE